LTEIPYGSCVSWRIPPDQNEFFKRNFGHLQNIIARGPETHSSMIMSEYREIQDAYYEYELSVTARINIYQYNPNSTVFDILAAQAVKVNALESLRRDT